MSLLQMSLAGALIILVIVLLRSVALHKLPKTAFLLLWAIALARLLLPYSLPSAFSVYSLWDRLTPAAEAPQPVSTVRYFAAMPGTTETSAAFSPAPTPSAGLQIDPWRCAWLIGGIVCALFFAAAYYKCRREFRASLPVESEFIDHWCAGNTRRRLSVRQSDRVAAPLTYGVFRPVILLPKTIDWEDEETLRYALAHELVHIRRFDAVSKLLLTAAVCVHWFNPLVWVMYILANRDLEISCDETVIRRSGGTGAAYARALIRMEEHKIGFAPLSSSFSRNAIEERIIAIMKIKKTSALAILMAMVLIAATGAVFATSAAIPPAEQTDRAPNALTVTAEKDLLLYTDPNTGAVYYSEDGGKTFLSQEEFDALFSDPDIEWWTYEGYKAWLEDEKVALQSMLGERGWTGGRGEFVWTQEIIDESIALYEQILSDIEHGYLVSKTVNGSEETMLAMGTWDRIAGMNEMQIGLEIPPMEEFEPFGISFDPDENALYYKGEKILYFEDSVDMGDGGTASRCNYYRADGTVSLRTVRQPIRNADGSTDPFGPLLRLEALTAAEAEERIDAYLSFDMEGITVYAIENADIADSENALKPYVPFGLKYRINPRSGELSMEYQAKAVHSVFDAQTGLWIANNMHGTELPAGAIDLEAVYENGRLTGLRESNPPHHIQHAVQLTTADVSGEVEEGTPLADMFDKYAPYGISYEEKETANGTERSLYLNGRFVNGLSDRKPDGGVFSFSSTRQREDGLKLHAVYENGVLTGLAEA